MAPELNTPADVVAFYEAGVESDRLSVGRGVLESARTRELIARFLPRGARVADVGGAVGHYAAWLAGLGHRVELVDPVERHLDEARRRAGRPARFAVHRGDARALPLPGASFDAVLLLGPLYHLGERSERLAALAEAVRVCRPAGVVFAAAISRFSPLLDAVHLRGLRGAQEFENVEAETAAGRRVGPERRSSPFPDAYFHRPDELAGELRAAGLTLDGVYGIEGPGWLLEDVERGWADAAVRERILRAARMVERDPDIRALSPHLLAVGITPSAPAGGRPARRPS